MHITSKGQVTIPKHIRERFGFLPNTDVDFEVDEDGIRLVKKREKGRKKSRGQRAVRLLRGSGTVRMSTDEILALTRDA